MTALYRVTTYDEQTFWTSDLRKAESDFDFYLSRAEDDEIDLADDYVELEKVELYEFGRVYRDILDIEDQLGEVATTVKRVTWVNDEEGFLLRKSSWEETK